jgi:hypothetical protein
MEFRFQPDLFELTPGPDRYRSGAVDRRQRNAGPAHDAMDQFAGAGSQGGPLSHG